MNTVTLPFMTHRVAVEGTACCLDHRSDEHTDYCTVNTYDSATTGFWIERNANYGWPELKFNLPGNQQATITFVGNDLERLIAALAQHLPGVQQ